MEWLFDLSAYHWLVLGLLLLGADALGAAGFLLGAGIAALATGVVVFIAPELSASLQLIVFSVSALVASYLYIGVFRQAQDEAGAPQLNQRAAALIGHRFELTDTLTDGTGSVQIGDTYWHVSADTELSSGTRVEVVAAEPMKLHLASVASL